MGHIRTDNRVITGRERLEVSPNPVSVCGGVSVALGHLVVSELGQICKTASCGR